MDRMRKKGRMRWNRYEKGVEVRLDKDHANSSIVTVVNQTPRGMFTTVTDGEGEWGVMTNRLSPKESDEIQTEE